jgi:hypothetical protein
MIIHDEKVKNFKGGGQFQGTVLAFAWGARKTMKTLSE